MPDKQNHYRLDFIQALLSFDERSRKIISLLNFARVNSLLKGLAEDV